MPHTPLIPAKAGIQSHLPHDSWPWVPPWQNEQKSQNFTFANARTLAPGIRTSSLV